MAESNNPAPDANGGDSGGAAVALQNVYVKDLSFEAPQGPFVPAQNQDPRMGLNMTTTSSPLGPDVHEVVLTITLEAKNGEIPVYIAEVKQAGVFVVRGFGPDDTRRVLGAFAPNVLFPYVRQTVSDLITKGGFPAFYLPPVNFDALYERSLAERATQQAAGNTIPLQVN